MPAFNYQISITGDCSSLSNGSISILPYGGTSPYTVDWFSPDLGTPDVVTTSPSVRTTLSAGTYVVNINDSTVPVNNYFTVNIPVSSGVCASILGVQSTTCNLDNGSVTGTSTSEYSSTSFYLYNSSDTYITSATTNTSTVIFGGLSADSYYITALDLGGCTGKSQNFIIQPSQEFTFGLYMVRNSSCGGSPIGKLYVTGQTGVSPYTYLWSTNETTSSITGLTAGNYSVQVTDSLGCSQTQSATVTDVDPVGFGSFTVTQPTCFASDGTIIMTITGGTGPYYYSASTGYVEISYSQTFTLSGLSSGQYNFLVTDAAFCTTTAGTVLNNPNGINSVTVNSFNSTCSSTNGQIIVTVNGGTAPYNYTIVDGLGNSTTNSSSNTTYSFTNLSSDTYEIIVTDAGSCVYSQSVTIIAENSYTISTSATTTTCGQSNGTIYVELTSGATAPYTYFLNNSPVLVGSSITSTTISNLSTGSYTVSVVDSTGCEQSSLVYVGSSSPVNFSLYSTSCGSGSNGIINAFINSGEPPFTFVWSDNVPSNPQEISVSGLSAGDYTLTIIDSNGCSLTRNTTISCSSLYTSYQTYVVATQTFQVQSQSKYGLLQMLNEGYLDLTADNTGCVFNSATFTANISIIPLGSTYSSLFYTSTSLTSAPSDNLWYNTITSLLNSIPGIGSVTVDVINNQINITSSTTNSSLLNQEIIIELSIVYDIMCLT